MIKVFIQPYDFSDLRSCALEAQALAYTEYEASPVCLCHLTAYIALHKQLAV